MGISAGLAAFRDPESQVRDMTREQRVEFYSTAWNYYRNQQFSRRNGVDWTDYLAARELYKKTRLIYNPVPSIVDFYVDNIWRAARNDAFESLVTPASTKTDDKLLAAIAQLDQWGNFLAEKSKIIRYAAATGNCLVEGIDDLDRQKILHKTIWPGYVTEIQLNDTGDVLGYTLEYDVYDAAVGGTYRYKKVVTKDSFLYFKDDYSFVPDGKTAAEEPNPYGFVFAVWLRHTDDGFDYGLPACMHLDKVDEANGLGSHLHDNIHKAVESPKILSMDGEAVPIIGGTVDKKTGIITPNDPRLNWVVLKTKPGATVADLAGSLKLAEAHPYLKEMLASFSDDYPELQAASIIKENSQLSGAALERLLGPAQNRLNGVQANYNQQLTKFRQMGIAVGGFRAKNGGWQGESKQRDAFKQFDLGSYEKGDLDFLLMPSVLVQNTEAENEDLLIKKASRATSMQGLVDTQEQLSIAGYSTEKIAELESRMKPSDTENTLSEMDARLDVANKGEGIITHEDQLRIIYPNASDAEIKKKLEQFGQTEPVRNANQFPTDVIDENDNEDPQETV